jgi:hypothetical protein
VKDAFSNALGCDEGHGADGSELHHRLLQRCYLCGTSRLSTRWVWAINRIGKTMKIPNWVPWSVGGRFYPERSDG